MEGRTIERAKIWQESLRKNLGMVKIYMHRSKILPYPPGIIESVLEQICNRILCPVEVVEIWGSGVKTRWNLPIRIGENRALSWDSIQESSCRVILVAGQERQCGVIAWPPCQGGCNRKALVLRMVELRVGRAAKTAQSIEKVSVFIDGATEIERSLDPVIAAGLQLDLMEGFQRGPFTDQVKDPPGETCPYSTDAGPLRTSIRSRKYGSIRGVAATRGLSLIPSRYSSRLNPRR